MFNLYKLLRSLNIHKYKAVPTVWRNKLLCSLNIHKDKAVPTVWRIYRTTVSDSWREYYLVCERCGRRR